MNSLEHTFFGADWIVLDTIVVVFGSLVMVGNYLEQPFSYSGKSRVFYPMK